MANAEAWSEGWNLGQNLAAGQRARKEMLADEDRHRKVQDLHELMYSIRDKPGGPNENDMKALGDIEVQLNQIYHPIHAPGALQKDWDFLKGLITRKKAAAPVPPPAAPVGSDTPTTSETSIAVPPQDVTLSGSALNKIQQSIAPPQAQPNSAPPPAKTLVSLGEELRNVQQPQPKPPEEKPPEEKLSGLRPGPEPPAVTLQGLPGYNVQIPATPQPKVAPVVSETMAVPPAHIRGLIAPGNIPIWNRPVIRNDDGTTSSELSTSFVDENPKSPYYGKEVLVPTIVDGKFLSADGKKPEQGSDADTAMKQAAWEHYKKTGEHLGVFDNAKDADKYAQGMLHSRGERPQPPAGAYDPKPSKYEQKLKAQQEQGKAAAELFARGGPPTPEDSVDQGMKLFDHFKPNATQEERQRHLNLLIDATLNSMLGLKAASTKWVYKTGTMPGTNERITVKYDEKDPNGTIQMLDGSPVPVDFKLDAGGKGPKGLKYIKNERAIVNQDNPSERYYDGDPKNPPEIQRMFAGVHDAENVAYKLAEDIAKARGAGYNDSRPTTVQDLTTGEVKTIPFREVREGRGRYVVSPEYDKWSPRVNMLEDLRGQSRVLRNQINVLAAKGEFDFKGQVLTALQKAFTDEHPASTMDNLIANGALSELTPDQQRYVILASGMIEQAMGMRQILGTGQGSDEVRKQIMRTIPGLLVPTPQFALEQMDQFDGTLERVHRFIPSNIQLQYNTVGEPWSVGDKPSRYTGEPGGAKAGARAASQGATKPRHSLKKAMALPFNQGKTEAQVRADLEGHGYEVVP